jgi:hypothetical protein
MNEEIGKNHGEMTKILFIDLENCPSQILQLQENLEQYDQVVICYAKTGVKIPLDWLIPLSHTVVKNKLHIYKMANVGKNSADFGLCFFAGMLMQQFQKKVEFTIISNDSDLDHLVNLLIAQGCLAQRMGIKKENKNGVTSQKELELSPIKQYCRYLLGHNNNRPAKQDSLLNSLHHQFKELPKIAEKVFNLLLQKKAITIVQNKVIYNETIIQLIVNQD